MSWCSQSVISFTRQNGWNETSCSPELNHLLPALINISWACMQLVIQLRLGDHACAWTHAMQIWVWAGWGYCQDGCSHRQLTQDPRSVEGIRPYSALLSNPLTASCFNRFVAVTVHLSPLFFPDRILDFFGYHPPRHTPVVLLPPRAGICTS